MSSYIVFHPDSDRQSVRVEGFAITEDKQGAAPWTGNVWVDARDGGNEDPWCLSQPWLYSYCHATQLQRGTMKPGDMIFFVSGDGADRDSFTCDTVFIVKRKHEWQRGVSDFGWVPSGAPPGLLHHQQGGDQVWQRHLRFGLPQEKGHSGRYTFEAAGFEGSGEPYSFLPLQTSGTRTTVEIDMLPQVVKGAIREKRKGKYPVRLSHEDATSLCGLLISQSPIKVVKIVRELDPVTMPRSGACGSGRGCR